LKKKACSIVLFHQSVSAVSPDSLFFSLATEKKEKTRKDLSKLVDFEYYGFCDEDDPILLEAEAAAELRGFLPSLPFLCISFSLCHSFLSFTFAAQSS
jgi:hypothetical protein